MSGHMYEPFEIGQTFRIIPPEHPSSEDGRIDLITQRGAFGSGEHETTVSCLELLESLPNLSGKRVLDLGSGTGILAIAALKLGAAHALCVDIAAEAVETARHNCQVNAVDDRVEHVCGTLSDIGDSQFDLVLANIYGDILLDVAAPLVERTVSGGDLLLSGILWEYNYDVRNRYEQYHCTLVKNRMLPEFSSLWLKKQL